MQADLFDVRGKVALVTGASGGLGKRFAELLAGRGARVVLAARRQERLDDLVKSLRDCGHEVSAIVTDVLDDTSVVKAFEHATETFGCPQIIINNAGVSVPKPALALTRQDWDHVVDTNLRAAWIVAQTAAKNMVAHSVGGSIINIVSIAGAPRTMGNVLPYVVSKAGLSAVTRALAIELIQYGIRVNAIAPGLFDSELGSNSESAAERRRKMVERIPIGRTGAPEDLDGPLLLLASDASAYMTGSVVVVDGGWSESNL